jgi:hypothetical protein
MTRIAIDAAFEPVEVDFWGSLFETRAMPRSLARKARVIATKIDVLLNSEPDDEETAAREEEELIALYGELFDLKLVASKGGKRKASALLKQKWASDDLTGEGLAAFLARLTLAERKQMRDDLEEFVTSSPTGDRPT